MRYGISLGFVAVLVASILAMPILAGAKYTSQGFALTGEPLREVVVVRPDMFMGSLDSSGRQISDPEWLKQAHTNLQEALKRHPATKAVQWRFADWNDPASQPLSESFWKTYLDLNLDIAFKVPQGSFPMPPGANIGRHTKNLPKGYYEYRLPPRELEELRGADLGARYALLIKMYDAYTTDSAKLGRLLGGMANVMADGVATTPPPPHYGFSMLVDLQDGKIVWYYNDGAFGGDLRKPVSADKRVAQMLTGWPLPR